jgi:hypothetical protein
LLGHTKIETTVCYVGVELENALALFENTELSAIRAFPHRGNARMPPENWWSAASKIIGAKVSSKKMRPSELSGGHCGLGVFGMQNAESGCRKMTDLWGASPRALGN